MIQQNLIRLFEDAIRMNWEHPAMKDFGQKHVYTYAEVGEQIEKLHLLFHECGIEKNDKIALIGRNSCNWVMAYIATVTYGAIVVPILQDFKPADVTHIVNHSESKLLFANDNLWEPLDIHEMTSLKASFSLNDFRVLEIQHIVSEEEMKRAKKKKEEPVAEPALDANLLTHEHIEQLFADKFKGNFHRDCIRYDYKGNDEVASINYTSGTTGFSKGVITPCNALAVQVVYGMRTNLVGPSKRFVCFLPLAHAFGCAFDFLANFCGGGFTCYFGRPLATKLLLMAFAEVKPTTILTVPLILEKIYKKQIQPLLEDPRKSWVFYIPGLGSAVESQIKAKLLTAFGGEVNEIILGGAPLNAEVETFFKKINFPFTIGYGMTECAPLISHTPHEEFKLHSCGKRLEGFIEVKIDNPNNEGVGEILVKGEDVMYGYYKNEEATKATFTEDGWLKTGDLGTLDEDGTIYIKGRNKTMLLGPSGQNIYPEEIEAVLNNLPYVGESIVLQMPDLRIVALVYPDREAQDKDHLTDEQLRAQMEQNRKDANKLLAAYEQLAKVQIYPHEFEKTPKKSIKRFLYTSALIEG